MDGKASYYAPGMQADSWENSVYEPPPAGRGAYERERDTGGSRSEQVYGKQSEYHQSKNGYPNSNSNSKFSPPSVRNAGGRMASQDRDLPLPPPPPQSSQDDSHDDEEEFEVIPGAEDANGYPDISTPTIPLPPSSGSPPPVPRKSTDSYGRYARPESALSSDSGLGIPRESTDSSATGGTLMQSSLFRTEAQELRARWAAQEKEKEEREKRVREREREQHHKAMPRANGGYFDRRKWSVGTNASSTAASSEVQTPVSLGGGIARESVYMSESEFGGMRSDTGSAYGASTSRKRRGRTKSMIAREREREEEEMERAAAELAARKKWEKEQQLREEMEEEDRKKVSWSSDSLEDVANGVGVPFGRRSLKRLRDDAPLSD